MARFNWQAAIADLAAQVEGSVMAQRMFADLPNTCARMERERAALASHAAWLARSYCKRGRRQRARAQRAA